MNNQILAHQLRHEGIEIVTDKPVRFASGVLAIRKLDWEVIRQGSKSYGMAVDAMCQKVQSLEPDCLLPVPNGANEFTVDVAQRIGVDVHLLEKIDETREIVATQETLDRISQYERKVALDDVFTVGSSLLRLHKLVGGLSAAAIIWDRSEIDKELRNTFSEKHGFPVHALIHEHVPFN